MEQVIESMVAVVGERYRAHVRAAVLTRGPEVVARAIEAAQDERGHVDGARVFGGES